MAAIRVPFAKGRTPAPRRQPSAGDASGLYRANLERMARTSYAFLRELQSDPTFSAPEFDEFRYRASLVTTLIELDLAPDAMPPPPSAPF